MSRKRRNLQEQWHRRIWHPVTAWLPVPRIDGGWSWLTIVERRRKSYLREGVEYFKESGWEYRKRRQK